MGDALFGAESIAAVQSALGPGWAPLVRKLDQLGLSIGILLAVALGFWTRGRGAAVGLAVAAALGGVVTQFLWAALAMPRPTGSGITVYVEIAAPSFPSGHVVTATTLWGGLAGMGAIPGWVAVGVVLLVMASRLYMGAHFPGDLLAGALIGGGLAVLAARAWPRLWARLPPSPRWLLASGAGSAAAAGIGLVLLAPPSDADGWRAVGLGAGAVAAALAEARWIRFAPGGRRAALLGLAGLAPFLTVGAVLDGAVTGLATAAGAAWAFVGAPVLLARLRGESTTPDWIAAGMVDRSGQS